MKIKLTRKQASALRFAAIFLEPTNNSEFTEEFLTELLDAADVLIDAGAPGWILEGRKVYK